MYNLASTEHSSLFETEEVENLAFWCDFASWTYCETCGSVVEEKLMPSYVWRNPKSPVASCACGRQWYAVPSIHHVPQPLLGLTCSDIRCLRPLDVHTGRYVRKQNGYRLRTTPFRISFGPLSVMQKIAAIPDASRRQRLTHAYCCLLSYSHSTYRKFVRLRDRSNQEPFNFQLFSDDNFQGIECTLWPHL